MKIRLTETNDFFNCAQCYCPTFRNMELKDIEREQQENLKSYADVGYNSFLFNRTLSTIYIRKIVNVDTLRKVFETDIYGILK
jgi:hypothetical protein